MRVGSPRVGRLTSGFSFIAGRRCQACWHEAGVGGSCTAKGGSVGAWALALRFFLARAPIWPWPFEILSFSHWQNNFKYNALDELEQPRSGSKTVLSRFGSCIVFAGTAKDQELKKARQSSM